MLAVLTLASFLAEGYHYAADDGAIFVPSVIQKLHPKLYPVNGAFFQAHGHLSLFPLLASGLARVFGGSVEWSLLAWQLIGIFVLLSASLWLAESLFPSARASWSAVCLLAGVLPVFVAGTSIPIMDPYFTARTLSTPTTMLALTCAFTGSRLFAVIALLFSFALHPQMACFAALTIAAFLLLEHPPRLFRRMTALTCSILPAGVGWGHLEPSLRLPMEGRSFFFAARWTDLEWIGVLFPLAIFLMLWQLPVSHSNHLLRRVCGAAFLSGSAATVAFLLISLTPDLETLVRLQPMRDFQLIYVLMFLTAGAFLGQYLLVGHTWRWFLFLLVLGNLDLAMDHATYPSSAHVEWPAATSENEWVQGFLWVRSNTPEDALFALPPLYMQAHGEDRHGFRAIAQRSALADQIKDSGVASLFPELAPEWERQVAAQANWDRFGRYDFLHLAAEYKVSWIIVERSRDRGLDCRFRNSAISVCHV